MTLWEAYIHTYIYICVCIYIYISICTCASLSDSPHFFPQKMFLLYARVMNVQCRHSVFSSTQSVFFPLLNYQSLRTWKLKEVAQNKTSIWKNNYYVIFCLSFIFARSTPLFSLSTFLFKTMRSSLVFSNLVVSGQDSLNDIILKNIF